MTAKMGDGPIGWIVPKNKETAEVEASALAWCNETQPLVRPVVDNIAAAAERRDGDSLLMWHVTLAGLVAELETLLTQAPAIVVGDAEKN